VYGVSRGADAWVGCGGSGGGDGAWFRENNDGGDVAWAIGGPDTTDGAVLPNRPSISSTALRWVEAGVAAGVDRMLGPEPNMSASRS
jgi:hypothetical protein